MSIRQDLPTTCRHPQAPQDLPSHPTQREEVVKGGRGRERERENKTQMWSMPHTTTKTRWKDDRERHYSDGDDWLWCKWTRLEGQIPPHCCDCLLCQTQAEQDYNVYWNFHEIRSKMSFQFPSSDSRTSTCIRVSGIRWYTLEKESQGVMMKRLKWKISFNSSEK